MTALVMTLLAALVVIAGVDVVTALAAERWRAGGMVALVLVSAACAFGVLWRDGSRLIPRISALPRDR